MSNHVKLTKAQKSLLRAHLLHLVHYYCSLKSTVLRSNHLPSDGDETARLLNRIRIRQLFMTTSFRCTFQNNSMLAIINCMNWCVLFVLQNTLLYTYSSHTKSHPYLIYTSIRMTGYNEGRQILLKITIQSSTTNNLIILKFG